MKKRFKNRFKVRRYASSYKLRIPGSIWTVTGVGIRYKLILFRRFHVVNENPPRDDFCEDSLCIMTSSDPRISVNLAGGRRVLLGQAVRIHSQR